MGGMTIVRYFSPAFLNGDLIHDAIRNDDAGE
jgi:hypothetical protein